MRAPWLILATFVAGAPLIANSADAPVARKQTRAWSDLSVRPSAAVERGVFRFQPQYDGGLDTPYDRMQNVLRQMSFSPAPFAQYESAGRALRAEIPEVVRDVSQVMRPDTMRNRIARHLTTGMTIRDWLVRRDIVDRLNMKRRGWAHQAQNLRNLDEELAQLPEAITGGLHIGNPWGNPLLADWNGLRTEIEGVVAQMQQPAEPVRQRSRSVARPSARAVRPMSENPGFFEALGGMILFELDSDFARRELVWRRQNPRSF
jgi:hypothetical protein